MRKCPHGIAWAQNNSHEICPSALFTADAAGDMRLRRPRYGFRYRKQPCMIIYACGRHSRSGQSPGCAKPVTVPDVAVLSDFGVDSWAEGRLMRIANVLRDKGTVVTTVPPGASVADLLAEMAQSSVGAVVVVQGDAVVGMVWERDVVRLLHERGISLVSTLVSEIMNVDVIGCLPTDEVDDILRTMTERRIRHLPVLVDSRLSGIVSMGDLVKAKIGELEANRAFLESYIGAP